MEVRLPIAANDDVCEHPTFVALTLHDPEPVLSEAQQEVCASLVHHGLMGEVEAITFVCFLGEERTQRLRYSLKISSSGDECKNVIDLFRRRES